MGKLFWAIIALQVIIIVVVVLGVVRGIEYVTDKGIKNICETIWRGNNENSQR